MRKLKNNDKEKLKLEKISAMNSALITLKYISQTQYWYDAVYNGYPLREKLSYILLNNKMFYSQCYLIF